MMKLNTFQKRLTVGCLGILFTLLLSWPFAFQKTWSSYAELKKMESALSNVERSQKTISHLKEQLDGMQLAHGQVADSSNVKLIFKRVSDLSEKHQGLKIVRFPEIHAHPFKKYKIETFEVELEGDYENLLKFILDLEDQRAIGQLVSASFKLQKDLRAKNEFLRLTIYIQNTQKLLTQTETSMVEQA